MLSTNMAPKIFITGGTGFIGRALSSALLAADYEVIILSHRPDKAPPSILDPRVKLIPWDAAPSGDWTAMAEGAWALINLAGENIGAGRWTARRKKRLLESRINTTTALARTLLQMKNKPRVFIQASGIGYYGDAGERELTEESPSGTDFLSDLCRQWEQASQPIEDLGIRRVILRIAAVLGPHGGMLSKVIPAFRYFLGGCPGSGRQWFSWIHIDDVVRSLQLLLENQEVQGIFNLTAPNPVRAREFYHILGRALKRPCYFPQPGFMLKLALGQMARELLLASQRAFPARLSQAGYTFNYPEVKSALEQICIMVH